MPAPFQLTKGQDEALRKLSEFIPQPNPEQPFFRLSGSAGTGKTFVMSEVPALLRQGRRMIGTAPTHKAVKVLQGRMPDTECRTIHSFLGLKPVWKEGKSVLQRKRNYDPSEFFDVEVVALDEISMADSQILKYIREDAEMFNRKYVGVGDQYQLPPVDEIWSPFFDLQLPESQDANLTEIVRQAEGSPIIQTATTIRDAIISKTEPKIRGGKAEDGSGVHLMKKDQWLRMLERITKHESYLADPDFCRVIAYTNNAVLEYNQQVRGFLGENTSVPFAKGDNLTVNEAWTVDDEVIFNTGEEFQIVATEEHVHPIYSELKGWQVWLDGFTDMPVYVLDMLNCRDLLKQRLQKLASDAKSGNGQWHQFYRLNEYFADLRPLYAITAHKSQGSTFQNAFVDLRDIYTNRIKSEADRCLYVAVTRAAKNVFLIY